MGRDKPAAKRRDWRGSCPPGCSPRPGFPAKSRLAGRGIYTTAAIQSNPARCGAKRNTVRLTSGDAAWWRAARRSLRRGRPATMQGQGGGWRSALTLDARTTLEPTRLRSNERGEDGASNNFPTKSALSRGPPHRSPAHEPAPQRSEGVCGCGWHERSESDEGAVTGGAADGRRRHTQGSGWPGAACAGPCEERAGARRCRDGPDQRPPPERRGRERRRDSCGGAFHSTAKPLSAPISRRRDGAVHRELTRVGVRRYSRQRFRVARLRRDFL